jgi:sugar phosphate isomerase/epimerase
VPLLARLTRRRHFGLKAPITLEGHLDRRSFIGSLAALGSFPYLRRATGPHLDRIGIQLYSVRRELARDFEGTLASLASLGYKEVEFAGYFDRKPKEVRAILARHRLAAPSAHVPIESARQEWSRTLETANVIGHRYLVIPWLAPEDRPTMDEVERRAAEFNRLGEEAKRAGLRFGYHNHDFEFLPLEGRIPYDVLLRETDPAHVTFELDLMWIGKGGQDPVHYFAKYPGRFEMVHVKDSTGAPAYRHVDVGRGTIDFRRILARRHQAGIRHFFAEHDDPPDPLNFARASYQYLSRLELDKP